VKSEGQTGQEGNKEDNQGNISAMTMEKRQPRKKKESVVNKGH
jgi:hypothetical protein